MMKKFVTLLIGCSVVLATSAMAQQDQDQQKPKKDKKTQQAEQGAEAKPEASGHAQHAQGQQPHANSGAARGETGRQERATPAAKANAGAAARENAGARGNASPGANASARQNANAPKTENASAAASPKQGTAQRHNERAATNQPANKQASPAPAAAQAQSPAAATGRAAAGNKAAAKPDKAQVQQVKAEHANFRAQPRPEKVPAVTYNQTYRISGAEQWQGPQYEVFRSYQPQWHDAGWYRSTYPNVQLIGGGYYYFNNGYWYPAWGYDPGAQYYAWDGPIYTGRSAEPPDKVIADAQALLQAQGYYKGEVDGLLGPLTREALTAYQADHGLYTTAVIDQPTLDSLGLG